jgi:16S rRNA (adenine1518-N6/adenine1519-N6)-dimethyltransferase
MVGVRRSKAGGVQVSVVNALLKEAKRVLARKRFGQNFLIHQGIIDGIVRCLDLVPERDVVLEIGPGLGFLTQALLPCVKQLTCVELDRRMVSYLRQKFGTPVVSDEPLESVRYDLPERLRVIQQDILAFDAAGLEAPTFKVVGNLPYNITSGVLFKFIGELYEVAHPLRGRVSQLTFMVQKEVAERLVAKPDTKAYNPLSICAQYWFEPQLEFLVPSSAFEPQPKVTSAVVSLFPRREPLCQCDDLPLLYRLIRAGFQQRRKTIKNSLLCNTGLTLPQLEGALEACGLSMQLRPEVIAIEQWVALVNQLQDQH